MLLASAVVGVYSIWMETDFVMRVPGCTYTRLQFNYNLFAGIDDGSCLFDVLVVLWIAA